MEFIERYNKSKKAEEERYKEKREAEDIKENEQKEAICALLERKGATDIQTNGYWFIFHIDGMEVDFVNQAGRICGNLHRIPQTPEEKEFLQREGNLIMHFNVHDMKNEFQQNFQYYEFVINGDPVMGAEKVVNIMKKIKAGYATSTIPEIEAYDGNKQARPSANGCMMDFVLPVVIMFLLL